ncbi:flocculation protein FLO11-like isoform X2 [Portunus trituberculatus]|uniref:flocculation protein FLO11-like isoform X2 n=1 Tax=Portunus trituberculatus TaxID=210409 RepID=UPI001E1CC92C|nr:flocculation protein FLO11-like isoform X2 [Portunus trituberculatus]
MPRGSTCKAKGCTTNKNDNPELSFHSFPRNKERFKLWCELIERPDLNHGEAISNRMSMRVCSLHFEDHMYMSPTNKSRLIWCAVPKPVDIKVSEREEKTALVPVLPESDASEKSYLDPSCPEDIIIKEENLMDENSCNNVSPPSYCPESSSAQFLVDSKVGILEHSQSGQSVRERVESKSHLDNPVSGQALCSAKAEFLGPVTDASVSFDSSVLPSDGTSEITSIQEKNVCSIKENVINEPRQSVKEMDSNQDSIVCIPSEPLNSGSQLNKHNIPPSRISLPMDSSATSETKITISNVKNVSLSHNSANASLQSQAKSTSSQSSISSSNSFSAPQLDAASNCSIVLQKFPSRHQSKLLNSDSIEPFADTISMKENFCEKLEVNEETINERKSGCGENCGCNKCFAAAEVMKATSRRTYSGPIRRQIVKTKSGAKRTIMIVKKASLKNLRAKGLIQPIGTKYTANQAHSLQSSNKNIIQYVSVSTNDPSNNSSKGSQLEDSFPLKEADSCRKISSIQTLADDNCDGYSSSTDSVDEPEVSSHATQTPNPQAVNQDPQIPVKVSLVQTAISDAVNQHTQAPVTMPLAQTPITKSVYQHTQAPVTVPLAQTPIAESVNQDTQAPVTVSWAPVNGSDSLSFTFTVKLPPGFSTPSGISHESLQKATSLLNNTAQCTVSQPNLQTREDLNKKSSSHSLSNSGIAPDQRIKESKELASSHSITTVDSWQIDTPAAPSKHLLPPPVMSTYNRSSDSHSSESTSPTIHTSSASHLVHRPIHVTIPDLACETSSEEKKINSSRSLGERRGNQPSKIRPRNRESIQWIAVPSGSIHQTSLHLLELLNQ